MDIKILDAAPDDAEDIAYIQSQTWMDSYANPKSGISQKDIDDQVKEMNKQGFDRIVKKILEKNSHNWIAKDGEKIIGFVATHIENNTGSLEALHVLPKYQGKGVGKLLMNTALEWLKDMDNITIDVVTYNTKAKKFYEKFGFVETDLISDDPIKLFNGKIIQKVVMVKTLA